MIVGTIVTRELVVLGGAEVTTGGVAELGEVEGVVDDIEELEGGRILVVDAEELAVGNVKVNIDNHALSVEAIPESL